MGPFNAETLETISHLVDFGLVVCNKIAYGVQRPDPRWLRIRSPMVSLHSRMRKGTAVVLWCRSLLSEKTIIITDRTINDR